MTGSFQSMSHSKWDCKYHVVFIPKRRRKTMFGNLRKQLGAIFHELARQKDEKYFSVCVLDLLHSEGFCCSCISASLREIPQPDATNAVTRESAALIFAPRQTPDPSHVAFEHAQAAPYRQVPHTNGLDLAAGKSALSIQIKCVRSNTRIVVFELDNPFYIH